MIPLRDENPTRTTPWIVYALLALNIIVFLYNGEIGPHARNPLAGFELVPFEITKGIDIREATPIAAWLTVFTSMFMHANWLHIGGNMLYLWIFGNNIEDVLGHIKFLFFYLAVGAGAALAQIAVDPLARVPMVGASGAIAGVMGAYIVLYPRAKIISWFWFQLIVLPASVVLGIWIAIQVLNSAMLGSGMMPDGGVAYAAHTGGFVSGLVLILIFGGKRLLRGRYPVYYRGRRS